MKLYSKDKAVRLIENSLRSDRLSHAMIICGERGVGKKTLAKHIASQILCEKGDGVPCGVCKSCRMMALSAHPDFICVTASGKSGNYLADDLRAIIPDSNVSPNEGTYKVYFLPRIDKALPAAQNVLLKIIEEPPAHVVFLMTAESKDMILPTVLSRSICLNISECTEDECLEALLAEKIPESEAKDAVYRFGGNIGRCLEYLKGEDGKLSDTVAKIARAIAVGDEYGVLAAFSLSEKDRSLCLDILAALKTVIRDAVCFKLGAPLCSVCRGEAEALANKFMRSTLEKMYDSVSAAESKIAANGSAQLVLAGLCGELAT